MLSSILAALASGTSRRIIVTVVGILAIVLKSKLGIELDATGQAAIVAMVLGYLGQSAAKEAHENHLEAVTATPAPSVEDAKKSLEEAVKAGG